MFVYKKLPKFAEVFQEFRGRRLFGGIGALVVNDDVSRYLRKRGYMCLHKPVKAGLG
jgi:hypothetical protein